jgi:hypothetical protein
MYIWFTVFLQTITSSWRAVTSCHYSKHRIHQLLTVGGLLYTNQLTFGQTITKKSQLPEFVSFPEQLGDSSWCWLAIKRHTLKEKSTVSSFKLQQSCESKLHFILKLPLWRICIIADSQGAMFPLNPRWYNLIHHCFSFTSKCGLQGLSIARHSHNVKSFILHDLRGRKEHGAPKVSLCQQQT